MNVARPVQLPIGQRPKTSESARQPSAGDGRPEHMACRAGQQVLMEALGGFAHWSPSPADNAQQYPHVTVKNTFITLTADNEPTPDSSLHHGAVTCSARLSEPTPSAIPLDEDDGVQFAGAPTPEQSMQLGGQLLQRPPVAALDHVAQVSPPPAYQAPQIFREDSNGLPPPPQVSPSEASHGSHGRHLLMAALGGLSDSPTSPTSAQDGSHRVKIRNTFIEVEYGGDDFTNEDAPARPKTCKADLHGGALLRHGGSGSFETRAASSSSAPVPQPQTSVTYTQGPVVVVHSAPKQPTVIQTSAVQPVVQTTVVVPANTVQASTIVRAPATVVSMSAPPATAPTTSAPSLGSEFHGKVDAEGQPMCQPCAWFHKGTGCQNGNACRRCHLCPEGELKLRKKQKVQRLRGAEATAEGDATVSSMPNSTPGPASTASRLSVPGSSARRESSPRWADIGIDDA